MEATTASWASVMSSRSIGEKNLGRRKRHDDKQRTSDLRKKDQAEMTYNESDLNQNQTQKVSGSGLIDSRNAYIPSSMTDNRARQSSSDVRKEHQRSRSRDWEDNSSQSQLHNYHHIRNSIDTYRENVTKVCRDTIHNQCTKGTECPLYHPPLDDGGSQEQKIPWFAICHNHLLGICDRLECSFFHISKQDEVMYRSSGYIYPELVERAVHKSLVENHSLIGARHYCKAFLRGRCNVKNCQYRHLNKREYADVIFYELLDEFQYLFGIPDPGSFSGHPSNPLVEGNPGVMKDMNEESGHIKPGLDFESERKRTRFSSVDVGITVEDRKWDDPADNERKIELPMDENYGTSKLMEEIIILRNDNMELRRKAEKRIEKLREEVSKLVDTNAKLCADAAEKSNKYNAEIQLLLTTKTALVQEKNGLHGSVQELENKVDELHKALDELEEKKQALVQMMVQRNVELTTNLTKEVGKSQQTARELEEKNAALQEALTMERHKAQQPLRELERKYAELQKSFKREKQESEEALRKLENKNKILYNTLDQKVKEAVKRYEKDNKELRKNRSKDADKDLKRKMEDAEMKLADSRHSFIRLENILKESKDKRNQVELENEDLKKKLQKLHDEFSAWKNVKEFDNTLGYRPRNRGDEYSWNEDYRGARHNADGGRLGLQSWNRPGAREDNVYPMELLRHDRRNRDRPTADMGGLEYSNVGYCRRGESMQGLSPHNELSNTIDLNLRRPETSRDYDSNTITQTLMEYFQGSNDEISHKNPNISSQGYKEPPKTSGHTASYQAPPPPMLSNMN
ncbi:hypothetical protein Pmani_027418 [Petrolisthes manimaculis]|uniref:C3H1-type domain-containing protein n=1 Tax=Petrolisthes manimaculis TaxID=1843537 RepID=A0AAE1P3K4_9EUCA|nr:hypothetical protein Pmani_027418 [Petrolisthes manimaculis]